MSDFDAKSFTKVPKLDEPPKSGTRMRRVNTSLPKIAPEMQEDFEDKRSVRSHVSEVSIGASKKLEDAMIASNKDDQGNKTTITRICLTGGPCAGKTTALTNLSLHLK